MSILNINMNVVYTIINLLVLTILFRVFLFKPVDRILVQRQKDVDAEMKAAKDARHDAEELKLDYEIKLKEQNADIDRILSESREKAYEQYNEIVKTAGREADSIREEARMHARADAERERARYLADLTDVVIDAASKIAANSHSVETDSELYDSFIEESLIPKKDS
jgi:F-type H+-transporting ATPase subunit b